jgi:hypothetical protein
MFVGTQRMGVVNTTGGVASQQKFLLNDKLFDLNPFQKTTGGNVIGAGQVPSTDRIHIKNVDMDLQIQNVDRCATNLELIVLQVKKDWNESPFEMATTIWNQAMAWKQLGQGAAVEPIDAGHVGTIGYGNAYVYGTSPFSEKYFNRYLKCKWRKSFTLDAGNTMKFLFKIKMNKTFRHDVALKGESDNMYHTKGDLHFFLISRPVPLSVIRKVEPYDILSVTTGPTNIVWTSTQHYDITSLGPLSVEYDRLAPGFVTGFGDTTVSAMIDDEDEIVQDRNVGNNPAP